MKLLRSPSERLPSRAWIPFVVLAGTLLLTGIASFYVQKTVDANDRVRFERSVQEIHSAIDGRLETCVTLLRAGTGLFAASNEVEQDEFRKFVAQMDLPRNYPGIQGIGFSLRLAPDQRDQLAAKMRQTGHPNFKIYPEGNRPEYYSIIYLEPLDRRNQVAIGYDMSTEPVRRAAMEQARDSGLPVASGRVTLVQEIDDDKQPGFLIYAPVYRHDLPAGTVDERRAALVGFVYAPFRARDLLHGTLANLEYRGVNFKIYDGAARFGENLLYDSATQADEARASDRFMAQTATRIAERPWALSFTSGTEFDSAWPVNFALMTLVGGGLLSLLLFSITTSQTRARVVAERAARELKQSEKSLRKSLTEQEQAEAALRQSEEVLRLANYRFRVAEEASKSFHYDWNLETDTVIRSENFSQVLGYQLDEVADTWEAWKALTHPEDFLLSKEEAIAYLNQLPDENLETEYRVRHKDGRYRHLYNRGIILRDERGKARRIIGQTVDITERKLAEVKLGEANLLAIVEYERLLERIAALAQALGAARDLPPIFRALREFAAASVPCDGLFVSLYDPAADIRTACYGWGDGVEFDVLGLPPMPVTVDGLNSRAVRSGETVVSDDYSKDTRGHPGVTVGPDNGLRPQSSMAVPMSMLGRVIGTIEVQSYELAAYKEGHATAMRMAANLTAVAIENAQLLARESQARTEAEESNRLKDEFLAIVSHELRTPLTAILGWARMLDSENLNETVTTRAIQTILRNAKSQAQIIDDILDVSRIVTGNLHLHLEPTELAPLIDAAINVVRPTAEAKGISIMTHFAERPVVVAGDAHRLQQVAWNLLSNAVKFTPEHGAVHVRVYESDSYAKIEVSDNGPGIDPSFLPYVFERFRQADSSTTRTYGGLGLGLAIVRHLVEIHGGNVQAESKGERKGAKFTVSLPLLSAAVDDRPVAQPVSTRSGPLLDGVHVLLVDDDPATLEMISLALTGYGAKVTAASSAPEAIAALERSRIDVLVSDIAMPNEDGYELIQKVRALETVGAIGIPAVAITAYAREQDRDRALSSGYQSFLPKPIEPLELVSLVARLASKAQQIDVEKASSSPLPLGEGLGERG